MNNADLSTQSDKDVWSIVSELYSLLIICEKEVGMTPLKQFVHIGEINIGYLLFLVVIYSQGTTSTIYSENLRY